MNIVNLTMYSELKWILSTFSGVHKHQNQAEVKCQLYSLGNTVNNNTNNTVVTVISITTQAYE